MRVTPLSIGLLIVLSGLLGPLSSLSEMPAGALSDASWWRGIGEQAIRGLASGGLAAVAVVASAYGIELRNRARGEQP